MRESTSTSSGPSETIGLDPQHAVAAVERGSDDRPERRLLGDPDVAPRPDERWAGCEPGRPTEQRRAEPAEVPVPGHVRPPPGARLPRDLQEGIESTRADRQFMRSRTARAACARRTSNRSAARVLRRVDIADARETADLNDRARARRTATVAKPVVVAVAALHRQAHVAPVELPGRRARREARSRRRCHLPRVEAFCRHQPRSFDEGGDRVVPGGGEWRTSGFDVELAPTCQLERQRLGAARDRCQRLGCVGTVRTEEPFDVRAAHASNAEPAIRTVANA